ncbi:hypothetical protein PSPO01_03460 [Paraphaeosphaeria sporulosa]
MRIEQSQMPDRITGPHRKCHRVPPLFSYAGPIQRSGDGESQVEAVTNEGCRATQTGDSGCGGTASSGLGRDGALVEAAAGPSEGLPCMFWRAGATATLLTSLEQPNNGRQEHPGVSRNPARRGHRDNGQGFPGSEGWARGEAWPQCNEETQRWGLKPSWRGAKTPDGVRCLHLVLQRQSQRRQPRLVQVAIQSSWRGKETPRACPPPFRRHVVACGRFGMLSRSRGRAVVIVRGIWRHAPLAGYNALVCKGRFARKHAGWIWDLPDGNCGGGRVDATGLTAPARWMAQAPGLGCPHGELLEDMTDCQAVRLLLCNAGERRTGAPAAVALQRTAWPRGRAALEQRDPVARVVGSVSAGAQLGRSRLLWSSGCSEVVSASVAVGRREDPMAVPDVPHTAASGPSPSRSRSLAGGDRRQNKGPPRHEGDGAFWILQRTTMRRIGRQRGIREPRRDWPARTHPCAHHAPLEPRVPTPASAHHTPRVSPLSRHISGQRPALCHCCCSVCRAWAVPSLHRHVSVSLPLPSALCPLPSVLCPNRPTLIKQAVA